MKEHGMTDEEMSAALRQYWERIHGAWTGKQWVWAYTDLAPAVCERCKVAPPRRLEPMCSGCMVGYRAKSA